MLPAKLQQKVIDNAHDSGHLGATKTKSMLRAKYWFPYLNSTVEHTIGQCYECKVTSKQEPWEVISVDFIGSYSDGHYNLVAINKRTRYPEVEPLYSTGHKTTKEKLKKIFAPPERLESENRPPFNSKKFAEFAEKEGFTHHRVTPLHLRANGESERFMQTPEQDRTDSPPPRQRQTSEEHSYTRHDYCLLGHTSPSHRPYKAMNSRTVQTKLDYTPHIK